MDRLRPNAHQEYKIGMKVPMPEKKPDIRPAFDGKSSTSFRPARKPARFE